MSRKKTVKRAPAKKTKKSRRSKQAKRKKSFVAEQAIRKITRVSLNKLPTSNLKEVNQQLKNRYGDAEILIHSKSK